MKKLTNICCGTNGCTNETFYIIISVDRNFTIQCAKCQELIILPFIIDDEAVAKTMEHIEQFDDIYKK